MLLKRYLQGYALATKQDFAYWSGLASLDAKRAFVELEAELEAFQLDGKSETYYRLKDMPPAATGSLGLRLLAKFDPLIMAFRDKSILIPEGSRVFVFRKAGQVEAVVLSEGEAIGTWRISRRGRVADISVEPLRPFKPLDMKRLDQEASRMAKQLGYSGAEIRFVEPFGSHDRMES